MTGELFGEERFCRPAGAVDISASLKWLLVDTCRYSQQSNRSVDADQRPEEGLVCRYGGSGMVRQINRTQPVVCAATEPSLAGRGGANLADCQIAEADAAATNPATAQRLWLLGQQWVDSPPGSRSSATEK